MDNLDLLTSFISKAGKRKAAAETPTLEDDISDITFLLHWFSQFSLDDLLEMPLKKFDALLKNAKADYFTEHLQNLVVVSHAMGDQKAGEAYAKKLVNEIKRLRQ